MLNLNGVLPIEVLHDIRDYTNLRFTDSTKYRAPEAMALYEQRILPNKRIFDLCQECSDVDLVIPPVSYVPDGIVMHFYGSTVVPTSFSPITKKVTCITLQELPATYKPLHGYEVELVHTPIYNYFDQYIRLYGKHPDLQEVPAKQLLDNIVNEAIDLNAADITISTRSKAAIVYYNVRKKKVNSQRIISSTNMEDIIKVLCFESPMDDTSNAPKYVGVSLNDAYRGRVVINKKYEGYAITIRLLPNAAFEKDLDCLGLTKQTVEFFRDTFINRELGLRLIVGSTMSGKNTTSLACLKELTTAFDYKVVSVEMPVEQELQGVEQINCNDEEEYELTINSLLRQNPDFVYITEIGDTTAIPIMRVTNTGKRILATLHANSCVDVIGRLIDITGLSTDRIIQTLHSVVYQELVRDEETDTIRPKNKFIYFSQERKNRLYGESYGNILKLLSQWEGGDVW